MRLEKLAKNMIKLEARMGQSVAAAVCSLEGRACYGRGEGGEAARGRTSIRQRDEAMKPQQKRAENTAAEPCFSGGGAKAACCAVSRW